MKSLEIGTILASVMHESKNRISSVLYQLQKLKELPKSDSSIKSIEMIEESLKQLNDEWVEYLYLYRLASDVYVIHTDLLRVDEFLDDQVFILSNSAASKGLILEYKCPEELVAYFDERLITSVISTAFYNAMRYAKSTILLSAEISGPYLVLNIEDDGAGFSEKITEADKGFHSNEGTGLGLYFSELSAKAHSHNNLSGYIEKSRSARLNGACLKIYLPQ